MHYLYIEACYLMRGHHCEYVQSAVVFDRALATGGASGGAAAEKSVIAPQWVPITQLVLLTMKVNLKGRVMTSLKSNAA